MSDDPTEPAGLVASARQRLAPTIARVTRSAHGATVELTDQAGHIVWPEYAHGPNRLLALLAAEQRYLVEQTGADSTAGATYVDKARTREQGWVHQHLRARGSGPDATGGGLGWSMTSNLLARCRTCGEYLSLDPNDTASCLCGDLNKDMDAGRFGSRLGDGAIDIYQTRPGP